MVKIDVYVELINIGSSRSSQPASQPASQASRQSASQRTKQPTNQPTIQPASQPASQALASYVGKEQVPVGQLFRTFLEPYLLSSIVVASTSSPHHRRRRRRRRRRHCRLVGCLSRIDFACFATTWHTKTEKMKTTATIKPCHATPCYTCIRMEYNATSNIIQTYFVY
uniref:Uncharacterized protein n=1 Tax=Glossina palpalis gambiensis TaxID=67801 RepID=A0A1B0B1T1_9MUSC